MRRSLKYGYTIRPALDGVTALKIAATNPKPDMILLDIMMPGMDGYEVMRLLQANDDTREVPVIFVTADQDIESELMGFDLGAVDYITKPFNPVYFVIIYFAVVEWQGAKPNFKHLNFAPQSSYSRFLLRQFYQASPNRPFAKCCSRHT